MTGDLAPQELHRSIAGRILLTPNKEKDMIRSFVASATLATLISGCGTVDIQQIARSMYNVPATGVSEFDGTRFVRMSNIACLGEQVIRIDLYRSSGMDDGTAVLKVKVTGAHSIASGDSLHFNVDGESLDFATIDPTTETEEVYPARYTSGYYGGGTYVPPVYSSATIASTKRYLIGLEAVDQIASGKRVVVKIDFRRSYVEGICSTPEQAVTTDSRWNKEMSGTEGFKGFSELSKTLK